MIINLELEFWRSSSGYDYTNDFVQLADEADYWRSQFPPNYLRTEVYMGKFDNDDEPSDATQVAYFMSKLDRVLIANYNNQVSNFASDYLLRNCLLNLGGNSVRPMEIWILYGSWYVPCKGDGVQGQIIKDGTPGFDGLEDIENAFASEYNADRTRYNSVPNYFFGGHAWFGFGSRCLQTFVAHDRPFSVSLGRHIARQTNPDCPIAVTARVTSNAPLNSGYQYTWTLPDGSTSTTTSTLKANTILVTGNGRVSVKVTNSSFPGENALDYRLIYSAPYHGAVGLPCKGLVKKGSEYLEMEFDESGDGLSLSVSENQLVISNNYLSAFKISAFDNIGRRISKFPGQIGIEQNLTLQLNSGIYILLFEGQDGEAYQKKVFIE